MEEFTNVHAVAAWGFGIALVFGFVANKTNFCTMGAISDVLHMGSKGRLGAWFLAIGIAIVGTQALVLLGVVDVAESRYLSPSFGWLGYLIGGLLFGVGMTLAAGCGQRNLVRLGAGNLKALVVVLVLGLTAYMTVRGLLGLVRVNVFEPASIDLASRGLPDEGLVTLIGMQLGDNRDGVARLIAALVIGFAFVGYALRQSALRHSRDNLLAGIVVGSAVVASWLVTGFVGRDDFDPVPVESMSFIAPVGSAINYLMTFTGSTINFGIALVFGMIAGSFLCAISTGTFRIETFSTRSEMVSHLLGGVLMGFGGVLALGCTIGQAVSGMSTLSLGSVVAFGSIYLGAVLTMKMEYYLLDELGFAHALRSTLADLFPVGRREPT